MKRENRNKKYNELQNKYPVFIFESFAYGSNHGSIWAEYTFELPGAFTFRPRFEIPSKEFFNAGSIDSKALGNLIFHIGMVELVSYWKATCSPTIIIRSHQLHKEQINWFRKLYFNGLGEFFYLNGLDPDPDDFVNILAEGEHIPEPFHIKSEDHYLVPVGGGKDSIVTLNLLGNKKTCRPFIINPRLATLQTANKAGFTRESLLEINRTIHPQLLKLNELGFLNGHTPFSALIAFMSLLAAAGIGYKNIALSNEASANESTVEGTLINHQYSKTYEFESDFRNYVKKYITTDINYFSFLRPLHEIQIAAIFSKYPQYFGVFNSCNAGSKTDTWCGKCAKCLFTYIILSPFIKPDIVKGIFGRNLFEDESLSEIFDELTGVSKVKPFDCIGTIQEVNVALCMTIKQFPENKLPKLLEKYAGSPNYPQYKNTDPSSLMKSFNNSHFLSKNLVNIIKEQL